MGCEKACIFMNVNIAAACVCLSVCVSECMVTRCVFSSLPLPPATFLSPPMSAARSGRFYLQCDGVEIAGWGIITRAIKERFTGWPVSGVSTVPTLQHCTVLGHQRKAQNGESEASRGMWWLKHEGEGHGSCSGICFMVGESEAEEENLILMLIRGQYSSKR